MAKFNADFWVASAAAAPVIALAAVVQFSDVTTAMERAARRVSQSALDSSQANTIANIAYYVTYYNIVMQAAIFTLSLIAILYSYDGALAASGPLVFVTILEAVGILLVVVSIMLTRASMRMTSELWIESAIATTTAETMEVVFDTARELHKANTAKQQFTLEEIAQKMEPASEKAAQELQGLGLQREDLLSRALEQLGRDGKLVVDLIPDNRGYAHLVVRF